MRFLKNIIGITAAAAVAVAGVLAIGVPPALAGESSGPQPYNEPTGGVSVPIFGLIAIGAFATIAIWQGIHDAKKKKEAEAEKKTELEEQEDFDKYFRSGATEDAPTPPSTDTGPAGDKAVEETPPATDDAATPDGATAN
jgi:hypothetical protein